jgi:hypothetical protein
LAITAAATSPNPTPNAAVGGTVVGSAAIFLARSCRAVRSSRFNATFRSLFLLENDLHFSLFFLESLILKRNNIFHFSQSL